MTKFEIGTTYTMRSAYDHNTIWAYTVTKRTAATVTITDGTETKTCRINRQLSEYRGCESVMPLGHYSFAPVLSADHPAA